MIKKLVSVSVVIFFVAVTAVFVNGFIFNRHNNTSILGNIPKNTAVNGTTNTLTNIVLSSTEISKHNNVGDCWLLIGQKVYNVTSYMYQHPGNADTIIPYCGKEASKAFADKGTGSPHSSQATNLLNGYFVGNLNDSINYSSPPNNPQTTNSRNGAGQQNGNENEYEDD